MNTEKKAPPSREPQVLELKYPVNLGSEIISELKFEPRLQAKHLRGLTINSDGGLNIDQMTPIIGRMTNQPNKVIGELDFSDYTKAINIVTDFLG